MKQTIFSEQKDFRVGDEDDTVNQTPVTTGVGAGAWVEIQSDLKPGAKVITRGNERLRPGQKVTGEPLEYELP